MDTVRSSDGTTIAYSVTGAGPTVVMVNGPLSDRTVSLPLAEALADHFTVATYDRRGRGASGDASSYAVQREVEDLEAVLGELGTAACVYGFSSGATLALRAASRGTRIAGLALHETAIAPNDGEWPPADLPRRLAELVAVGRPGDAVTLFRIHAGLLDAAFPLIHAERSWKTLRRMAQTCVYDATLMGPSAFPSEDLGAVGVPVLVMSEGDASPTARWCGKLVADALPNGAHLTLPGPDGSQPDVIAACLGQFFSGCTTTQSR